jgi:hypothetical protein
MSKQQLDAEAAEAQYRNALGLAEARGMRPLIAHCHRGLGRLYLQLKNPAVAEEYLTTAREAYNSLQMPFWAERTNVEPVAPV